MRTSVPLLVGAALAALAFSGCDTALLRQDMADQPKNRPLSPSPFFADGRSGRPILENTVARGALDNDAYNVGKDFAGFPPGLKVDRKFVERGEERYQIFCTPCHGVQGNGEGMIAMRGMKHPPSYHVDRLRQAPNGYFYDVMTNGFGAMYSYSDRIPPRDRWAIIAYVRALQLSRNARIGDLPESLRQKVMAGAAPKEGAKE
jgi:Cytochrome C oxidase, cbb3-type, subunit III